MHIGALDAKVRKELRQGLREIHDRTGLTTVFVTHDQEEAMELADLVAVMPSVAGLVMRRRGERTVGVLAPPVRLALEIGTVAAGTVRPVQLPPERDSRAREPGPEEGSPCLGAPLPTRAVHPATAAAAAAAAPIKSARFTPASRELGQRRACRTGHIRWDGEKARRAHASVYPVQTHDNADRTGSHRKKFPGTVHFGKTTSARRPPLARLDNVMLPP